MVDDEDERGEMVEYEAEDNGIRDTEDGGAYVKLSDNPARSDDFLDNLAEGIAETELDRLSSHFLELIARDKESRSKRDEQYEDGLRRTGLGNDAPGGASFKGASKVVHPMLINATVDFSARAMKEIFPPNGPAKDFIPGKITPEKVQKAKRKTTLMNWQLVTQCPDFRAELKQMLTQLPMGGAQYIKLRWNERRNRPDPLFVPIDEMYLPYSATSFYSAQRKTHVQYVTQAEFEERVESGWYRDVQLAMASDAPEQSASGKANDKIEGRAGDYYNEDGLRTVFEIYTVLSLDDAKADGPAPYILTVDKSSGKVLSIYRNWDELDDSQEELQWFVQFGFIPWRGAYPIGLPHMIGTLAGAATGALRALLDSAHMQTVATGMRLKGINGQQVDLQPGEITEIDGGVSTDDIRKLYMPVPFNQPSPVLMQLLGFVSELGNSVVRTALDDASDLNPNAPVGTTLARIEQGMVVYSAIHADLHDSMARLLRILHRLNAMYLDDEDVEREAGDEMATREDFDGPMDVVPVSDPNIFSEAQRFAQVQAIAQRAQGNPLYDQRKVEERILDTLKIPNASDLLAPTNEPKEQNAVNENAAASLGRPVAAFPEQNHIAHLKTHIEYMRSPIFGQNQLIAPKLLPIMMGHIIEHVTLWYTQAVFTVTNTVLGADIGEEMRDIDNAEERHALDKLLASAAEVALEQGAQQFAGIPQIIAEAMQLMQSFAPQPQPDPRTALEGQKLQLRAQEAQQSAALKQQEMQVDVVEADKDRAADMARDTMKQDREDQRKAAELAARDKMNTDDNQTAMKIVAAEIVSDERSALSTGTGINPNP